MGIKSEVFFHARVDPEGSQIKWFDVQILETILKFIYPVCFSMTLQGINVLTTSLSDVDPSASHLVQIGVSWIVVGRRR